MEKAFRNRYYLIFISALLGPLTTNSLIPIFEQLRINFGLSLIAQVSLTISFYILPFAVFQLFAGTFSDVIDKKLAVGIGYIIFTAGLFLSLMAVFAQNFLLFLIAFLIQGIGFSFINPTVLAILNIITPEPKKGMVMGLYNSTAGAGVALGGFLSSLAINLISPAFWYFIFVLNPIITILAFISFLFALKNCEALVCKTYDLGVLKEDSEKLGARELIKATLLQLKEGLNIVIFLLGIVGFFAFFTVITLTNTLNEQIRISLVNLTNEEVINYVSLILTINGLISVALSPITGNLLKKINPTIMLGAGFLLMLTVVFLPFGTSIVHYMLFSFLIYIGSALVWPALFKAAMDIDVKKSGTNSAIINSLRFLGYALVSPFYLLIGIPIIFYFVFFCDIITMGIIVYLKKFK